MDWVPLDLKTTRESLKSLSSLDERGEWITGFFQGASGALISGGEDASFMLGFSLGSEALANAEGNRVKISEVRRNAALKRWEKAGQEHVDDANASANGDANASAKPMHKTRQDKQDKQDRTLQAKKMAIPTEKEWVEYCTETWSDWHPSCAADSYAYYQSVGWRTKAGPIKDWKAIARTAHSNSVSWGRLQPKNGQTTLTRVFDSSYYEEK